MHIIVVGVDHTTAPIALREQLACSPSQIPQVLEAARQVAQESVLLSTCNRLELYALCSEADEGRTALLGVLSETRQVELAALQAHCYGKASGEAVGHLFEVACGLHSLVPGEPQIQGQVAEALALAQSANSAGPIMSALFRAALVAGKRARSETGMSRSAASVSQVAVQLARQLFPRLNEACVLLIGSGQMSELAARNLCDHGAQRLLIMNRTPEHAIALAQRFGAVHRSFAELAATLVEADVVISSTRAPHALLTPDLVQEVMKQRGGRSLLLIDIALPRDVDPAVGTLPGVHLSNLDDLQAAVSQGMHRRLQEFEQVQAMIAEEVGAFERWFRSLSVVATISDLRQRVDAFRKLELARTMRQSVRGRSMPRPCAISLIWKDTRMKRIRIGTRASTLAMIQTYQVIERLRQQWPDLEITIEQIQTRGDHITDVPLSQIGGDGVFVTEIERALHEKRIDVAVHSLKDLPTIQPVDLRLVIMGPREDVRDVFVAHEQGLQPGNNIRIGICSLRRMAQVRSLYPDAHILSIRGNVDTRLRKLEAHQYDGILLAAAGLHRLLLSHRLTGRRHAVSLSGWISAEDLQERLYGRMTYLPIQAVMPAPGQGALALEIRDQPELCELLAPLGDPLVQAATTAERMFMRHLGAGCYLPVAAFAGVQAETLTLQGLVISLDGQNVVRAHQSMTWTAATPFERAEQLGVAVANQALAQGAASILSALKASREQEQQYV